jgi:MaoC like domain
MATRTLDSSPSILPLYARAAAPMIPGASLLPFVPGRGKEIPEIELVLGGVQADPEQVAAYAKVCGFALRDHLPPTYPHVLAFPLHMAVMADGSFPFGAVGLVHVENQIVQRRRIAIGEQLTIRVQPTALQPHSKGRTFSLLTKVSADGEEVWESTSTMLRRGGDATTNHKTGAHHGSGELGGNGDSREAASAEWKLGGDLGRRYAAVSGDRNPIHMHSLSAKALGFPRAIAHGMWTKARCLAALESRLPDAFQVDVRFRKPILLPGGVEFASDGENDEITFAVRDAKRDTPHLDGRIEPSEAKPNDGRK